MDHYRNSFIVSDTININIQLKGRVAISFPTVAHCDSLFQFVVFAFGHISRWRVITSRSMSLKITECGEMIYAVTVTFTYNAWRLENFYGEMTATINK